MDRRAGQGRTKRWAGKIAGAAVALAVVCRAAAGDVEISDANVELAIQKAVVWLWAQQNEHGHWETGKDPNARDWAGNTALALLALVYAGENPRDQRMDQVLEWLAIQDLHGTYVYGLRAQLLAQLPGTKYTRRLERDLAWLLEAQAGPATQSPGAYDYVAVSRDAKAPNWDNSVTQFGVLGVWMAADAGLNVPPTYWEVVAEHFLRSQKGDGGWDYGKRGPGRSTGSMTAAGLASLFIVLDQRYADRSREAAGILAAINRGLDWLGREYTPENPPVLNEWAYYYLYGVERVGRASGYRYFRDKDWFRGGATYLLGKQKSAGQWSATGSNMTDLRNTAFATLVLCHSRAPVVFNKLALGPDWDGRLRDAANVARFAGHTFERVLNWQIVDLDHPLEDLTESPVLYWYGQRPATLDEVQIQKIREYCQRGGLVFAVAGQDEFRDTVNDLATRAFPELTPRPLPPDHPLFSGEVQFPVADPPLLLELHNGVRTLMLVCTRDIAAAWNRYSIRGRPTPELQLAANVYLYAVDKSLPRSRLETPAIPLRPREVERTVRVARLRYDGPWNVEPYGWTRLATYLQNETGVRLLISSGVALDSPELREFTVAHITGTARFTLSAEELRGLRVFLTNGGTLLADAAGGAAEFTAALEEQLRALLKDEPRTLPNDSPIVTGRGVAGAVDLAGVTYRRAARPAARGREYPKLQAFQLAERACVVFAALDLSHGLLGTPAFNVRGYESAGALDMMRNLILYAALPTIEKAREAAATSGPAE